MKCGTQVASLYNSYKNSRCSIKTPNTKEDVHTGYVQTRRVVPEQVRTHQQRSHDRSLYGMEEASGRPRRWAPRRYKPLMSSSGALSCLPHKNHLTPRGGWGAPPSRQTAEGISGSAILTPLECRSISRLDLSFKSANEMQLLEGVYVGV